MPFAKVYEVQDFNVTLVGPKDGAASVHDHKGRDSSLKTMFDGESISLVDPPSLQVR